MAPVVRWCLIRRDCPIGATFPQQGLGKSVVPYHLTLDSFCTEKSYRAIAGMMMPSVTLQSAAAAARPIRVR
jgi:hypothetical protein